MASLKPQPLAFSQRSLWAASGQSLSILGTRMGQSVGSLWSNFTSGVASSLLNRSLGLSAEDSHQSLAPGGNQRGYPMGINTLSPARPKMHLGAPRIISQPLLTPISRHFYDGFQRSRNVHRKDHARSSEAEPDMDAEDQERKLKFEDAKVRSLNSNGRVDYSIQE